MGNIARLVQNFNLWGVPKEVRLHHGEPNTESEIVASLCKKFDPFSQFFHLWQLTLRGLTAGRQRGNARS